MYPRIEAFGQSDAGCVREVNEDNFLCLDLSTAPAGSEPAAFLLAVADGIGGHAGGAVASAMAVQILREEIERVDGVAQIALEADGRGGDVLRGVAQRRQFGLQHVGAAAPASGHDPGFLGPVHQPSAFRKPFAQNAGTRQRRK